MNSSPQRHDNAIDEQAATWAARLDGDVLDASERAALDAWLAKSPEHRTALSGYCQFSADLEEQLPQLVAAGVVTMPSQKKTARRVLTFPRMLGVALAAAAALALAVWVAQPAPQVQNFATAVAQRSAETLADGTHVELNAHTSLRFENTRSERRVRLAGGEAFFSVTKDPSRPFIVETPTGSVRVTGTMFNVRSDLSAATAFEVTVVEGSVEVRPRDATGSPVPLKPGQQLSLSARATNASVQTLTPSALDDSLAWREGQIVFNDMPLPEAAARFAHYHGRSITIASELAGEHVGGRHSLDDLGGFLNFLTASLSAKITYEPSGAITVTAVRSAP